MPYVRRTWQNAPSSATPLNAAALNNIETGIEEALAKPGATDAAVEAIIADTGSDTYATLNSTIGSVAANTRPRGRRTVLMGDSITAYNGGISTATPVQATSGFDSKGMWRWANIMLSQALDIIGNSGIGGQEASQIAARFTTDVLNLNPDIVSILAGTNDEDDDNTTTYLQQMYEAAAAAGIFVVAFTIPPQTTGALAAYRQGVNDWIRDYVRTHPGMVLVDLAAVWQDTNQAGFVAKSAYLHDTTHPNTPGAQVAGRAIADVLAPLLPPSIENLPDSSAPGNMLTNARFAGTSGAPSGWAVTGSPVFSYVPRGDGKPGQILAVRVPIGGVVVLTQNVNKGVLLRTGDEYDMSVTIEPYDLERPGPNNQRINVFTQNYNGSTFTRVADAVYIDGGASYGNTRFPAAKGVFRAPRGVFASGMTLAQVVISLSGGGTYLLSDPVMRNLTMLEAGIIAPESVPHTNLITNSGFEVNTTDWSTGASAAIARTTTERFAGVASGQITHTANANSDGRFKKVTVAASTPTNYSLWVKAPSGHLGKFNMNWYVGGGSFLSTSSVNFTGTGDWQQIIGTVTSPGTAGDLLIAVGRNEGSPADTPVVYIDEVDVWQV